MKLIWNEPFIMSTWQLWKKYSDIIFDFLVYLYFWWKLKKSLICLKCQDYTQNIHGKEIDLLRVTVKVPGKRPPRAVAPAGPSPVPPAAAPGVNGLNKELTAADNTSTGTSPCVQVHRAFSPRVSGKRFPNYRITLFYTNPPKRPKPTTILRY